MKTIKAYKVFNSDWTCRNYDYKTNKGSAIGSKHKADGKIELCENGFHACFLPQKCFDYYDFNPQNKVAEVKLSGKILGGELDKYCSEKIEIVRELSWEEVLRIVNTGIGNSGHSNSGNWNSGDRNSRNRNSGNWNSGNSNSGNWNSGNWNSGNCNSGNSNSGNRNSGNSNSGNSNSGNWNSGNWNSGDRNSGYLNTDKPKIRIFNKETYLESIKFPDYFYFDLTKWIDWDNMSDEEKKEKPNAFVTGGYLLTYSYKEAWKMAFEKSSENEKKQTKELPNFDAELFFEITGIDYFLNEKDKSK